VVLMVNFLNYIPPYTGGTCVDIQLVEKNPRKEAYRKKFVLREVSFDAIRNSLFSGTHLYICHSFCVEENKTLSFPRTRIPYFYTIEDLDEYVKPAPKESILNSIINSLIPTDNFLKEEIIFLKYMSYLRKYITSYYDIIIKRNSSVKFHALPGTVANVERKQMKKHINGFSSVIELKLQKIMLNSGKIENVTIDPLLKGEEIFRKEENSIRDGYLALLWIRSVILRAGKVHIHPRDLSFCKTIQLLYTLWDMYKEDGLVKELQELHHELHNSNLYNNQNNQTMIESTCSNNTGTSNNTSTPVIINNGTQNKNNNIKNLKKIEKIMKSFVEATIMHFELIRQLPLSYKPFYGGRDSHNFLLLSFIWDVCSNVLKIKNFENTPPLEIEVLKTILDSNIWQTEMIVEKLKNYRIGCLKDISYKFAVLEKKILPPLCEAIHKFTHSPKIFYDITDEKGTVFYNLEINEIEENEKKK